MSNLAIIAIHQEKLANSEQRNERREYSIEIIKIFTKAINE